MSDGWTTVIDADRPPVVDFRLRELWRYRDLIGLFVRRDFVATYKQTVLGPAWHIVNPIMTTVVFTVVFGRIAGLPTDGIPPFLFYLSGTTIWNYFQRALTTTSNTFISNAGIFGKVYFPRLSVPISQLLSNLISFGIQFALFLSFMAWYASRGRPIDPNAWVLLTPGLLLIMAGLGMGGGVIISSMTTRYRDLTQLVGYGVGLLMYVTPVIYPYSSVPAGLKPWVLLNPATWVVETFRFAYLGSGSVDAVMLVYSGVFALGLLAVGVPMFHRIERTFVDTV